MTRRTKLWLPLLLAMLLVATIVVAACAKTATVTYVKGEGEVTGTAPATKTVNVGDEITIAKNTFTRTGYDFSGWSDGSKTYQPDETYKVNGDVTFTAQWTKKTVQGGHECESECPICHGCQNADCQESACTTKCPGNHEQPALDAREYFLVGGEFGWNKSANNTFARTEGTNTYTLEGVVLKVGAEFKLRYNTEWTVEDKQMSYGAHFFPADVFGTSTQWDSNAVVAAGKDGIYNVTLKTSNGLTATTERGENQITEFTFTRTGDLPAEPFVKGPFMGAIGSLTLDGGRMTEMSILSFFDGEEPQIFAQVVSAEGSFGNDSAAYTISADGAITITEDGETIGSGTIVGNVITVTITLDGAEGATKEVTFEGEMYKANVTDDGESQVWYIAEGTPLYLLVANRDNDTVVKVNGNAVPREQLATTKMPKEEVNIEIISPQQPTEKVYTGLFGASSATLTLRSDNTASLSIDGDVMNGNYTLNGTRVTLVLQFDEYDSMTYVLEIDDSANTFVVLDGMQAYSYTTFDGANTLTFDGKGGALLDGNKGTYVVNIDDYYYTIKSIELTFGSDVSTIYSDDYYGLTMVGTVTIGGNTYVFGDANHEFTGKLADFQGEYGYADLATAGDNALSANNQKFYKLKIEWNANFTAFRITVYSAPSSSAKYLQKKNGNTYSNITDQNAANQYVYYQVTSGMYLKLAFDGSDVKTVTIKNDRGETITWTLIPGTAPAYVCQNKCQICQGCLTTDCDHDVCKNNRCLGHEANEHDGTYLNSKGATNIQYYLDGVATKAVIEGNKITFYNAEGGVIAAIDLTWAENIGTGEHRGIYDVTVTADGEMITVKIEYGRNSYTDSFYTEGNEPTGNKYSETLKSYEGVWGGLLGSYTAFNIENGELSIKFDDGSTVEWMNVTIENVEQEDTLVLSFVTGSNKYGYIYFSSTTECTLQFNSGRATFVKGAEPGHDNDVTTGDNCGHDGCTCENCTGDGCDCNTDPTPGELGNVRVYEGTATKQVGMVSKKELVITKVTVDVANNTIIVEGTYAGTAFTTEALSMTTRNVGYYETARGGEETYCYTFTLPSNAGGLQMGLLVFDTDKTVRLLDHDSEGMLDGGEFTLGTSGDNGDDDDDDDDGDELGNVRVYEGTATKQVGMVSKKELVITKVTVDVANNTIIVEGTYAGTAFTTEALSMTTRAVGYYETTRGGEETYCFSFTLPSNAGSLQMGIMIFDTDKTVRLLDHDSEAMLEGGEFSISE